MASTSSGSSLRTITAAAGWQNELEAKVSAYRDLKAGNCYEMAELAFVYLAQNGLRPLEIAYLVPAAAVRVSVQVASPRTASSGRGAASLTRRVS